MSYRFLAAVFVVIGVVVLTVAQSTEPPRTPWGDPDLQGTWTNTTTTPLERPEQLAGTEVFTEEQRVELDEQAARNTHESHEDIGSNKLRADEAEHERADRQSGCAEWNEPELDILARQTPSKKSAQTHA